jgi:hypothetical protein
MTKNAGLSYVDLVIGLVLMAIVFCGIGFMVGVKSQPVVAGMSYSKVLASDNMSGGIKNARQYVTAETIAENWVDAIQSKFDNKAVSTGEIATYLATVLPKDTRKTSTIVNGDIYTVQAKVLEDAAYTRYLKDSLGNVNLVPVSITVSWNYPSPQACTLLTYVTLAH